MILPQALPVILPPFGNLTIEILKGTALVSLVGLRDLTFSADILRTARTQMEVPIGVPELFINVLIIYFVLAQIVSFTFRLLERIVSSRYEQRTGRSAVDTAQPTRSALTTGGAGAGGSGTGGV